MELVTFILFLVLGFSAMAFGRKTNDVLLTTFGALLLIFSGIAINSGLAISEIMTANVTGNVTITTPTQVLDTSWYIVAVSRLLILVGAFGWLQYVLTRTSLVEAEKIKKEK